MVILLFETIKVLFCFVLFCFVFLINDIKTICVLALNVCGVCVCVCVGGGGGGDGFITLLLFTLVEQVETY